MLCFRVALCVIAVNILLVAGARASPLYPLPQTIGADTGAGVVITLTDSGSNIAFDATQGPYDGVEDTIVAVINNSSQTVSSLALSGPSIFAFDFDGISTYGAPSNPSDPFGYAGPNNTYTVTDADNGFVNFTPKPLAPGDSTYFSLEEAITTAGAGGIQVGPIGGGTVPEPTTAALFGTGILGIGAYLLRKKKIGG